MGLRGNQGDPSWWVGSCVSKSTEKACHLGLTWEVVMSERCELNLRSRVAGDSGTVKAMGTGISGGYSGGTYSESRPSLRGDPALPGLWGLDSCPPTASPCLAGRTVGQWLPAPTGHAHDSGTHVGPGSLCPRRLHGSWYEGGHQA